MPRSFLLLACAIIAGCTLISSIKVVELQSFTGDENCQKDFFNFGNLQVRTVKPGVKQLVGMVELLQNIGPNLNVESQLYRVNAQGTFMVKSLSVSVCDLLDHGDTYCNVALLPPLSKCPIPKKRYSVRGFNYTRNDLEFMQTCNYYIRTTVHRGKKPICGATLNFTIVDRK